MEPSTRAGVTPAGESVTTARANRRPVVLQVLMGLVALSGAAGVTGLFASTPAVYDGDGWAVSGWVLGSLTGVVCAALAALGDRRHDGVVAEVFAGAAVVLLALAADSDAQGPFIALPSFLASLLVLATGAWGAWTIALERG